MVRKNCHRTPELKKNYYFKYKIQDTAQFIQNSFLKLDTHISCTIHWFIGLFSGVKIHYLSVSVSI